MSISDLSYVSMYCILLAVSISELSNVSIYFILMAVSISVLSYVSIYFILLAVSISQLSNVGVSFILLAVSINELSKLSISSWLIKQWSDAVSEPLAFSINQSMVASCMPYALQIIPLYKSKDADKFVNCRPISLHPLLQKYLKKNIKDCIILWNQN